MQKAMKPTNGTQNLESKLWQAADKLRNNMDAAEYKHVVLGLIFLKYISDAFQERYEQLVLDGDDAEDRDFYIMDNIFWVPAEARWQVLQDNAKSPQIGVVIDKAMASIERENVSLKGILSQDYARPQLDKVRLGELIDLIGTISMGDKLNRSLDILGRVYEYFLGQFANAEGKKGGQFYTPKSVVRLLVEMLEPYRGRIYDPCCGSGGMFVQSELFVEQHGGRIGDVAIYGQESNPTTWRLCKMNLAIRGIDGNIGKRAADTFRENLHPDLRADFIIANPPFNVSDWGGDKLISDARWQYGIPSSSNANYAWMQHMIYHLSERGRAGFVLSNGSMSSNTSNEGDIRKALIESDLIECMVALPPQLFYNTQIPACLWFVNKAKPAHRHGQILFIDARQAGTLINRTLRELSDEDVTGIADVLRRWRDPKEEYVDVAGLYKSADKAEVAGHGYVLTPGRYVGAGAVEEDDEPFVEKMARLTATLEEQFKESAELEKRIRENLRKLGHGN